MEMLGEKMNANNFGGWSKVNFKKNLRKIKM